MGVPLRPLAIGDAGRSVYRQFAPPPVLDGVLACGWHGHTGWARPLRVLPDGCADLVWDGTQLTVVSTVDAPLRWPVPAAAARVGVRLRCGAAGAVLGLPMTELPPGATTLSALWGDDARRATDILRSTMDQTEQVKTLETLVQKRNQAPDHRLLAAVRELNRPATRTAEVADRLGVSERTLRRHLLPAVGVGPKQLHRVRRFQHFLRRLPALAEQRTSLADVAAELGYADQSHLGRECRRLSGSSPAALVRGWARGRKVPDTGGPRP